VRTHRVEPSNIYAIWYERWSASFASERLGVEMASNPRVAERTNARMLRAFGVDGDAGFKEEEHAALAICEHDPARLITLCGLVLNGSELRNCVSREAFSKLTENFADRDLRIALKLHAFHPSRSRFHTDMERLPDLVRRNGEACVNAWRRTVSEQMALRLQLMRDDRDGSSTETVMEDSKLAADIVEAVCLVLEKQEN